MSSDSLPAGWKLVPLEPTQEMCVQGQWKAREWPQFPLRIMPIYAAMLAVAPEPPAARADSAVPSSHVSDQLSVLSDRGSGKGVQAPDGSTGLLPCPFCGSHALASSDALGLCLVTCTNCGAEISHSTLEKATSGWNRRPAHMLIKRAEWESLSPQARQLLGNAVLGGPGAPMGPYAEAAKRRLRQQFFDEANAAGRKAGEAVCAEPAPTTASAPANSETDDSCVACHPPEFAPMPAPLKKWPLEDIYAQGCLDGWRTGESILREALARLVEVIDAAGLKNLVRGVQLGPTVWFVKASDAMEAARSALAGIPLNASGDPTERSG